MEDIEEYNIIECIINSDVFEMPRKLQLIRALTTSQTEGSL